jgi:perosamine synthetase
VDILLNPKGSDETAVREDATAAHSIGHRRPLTNMPFEPKLRLLVTGQCTHKCPFCHNEGQSKKAPEVDVEALLPLLPRLRRLSRRITLSGGEPLQAKVLPRLLSVLYNCAFDVTIDTAGDELAEALDLLRLVSSLHVSLISLSPQNDLARCNGDLEKKLSALEVIRARYPTLSITINVPIVDKHVQVAELDRYLELSDRINASIKLISELAVKSVRGVRCDSWADRWESFADFLAKRGFEPGDVNTREVEYVHPRHLPWQFADIACVKTSREYGDGHCFSGMDYTINTNLTVQLCRWQSNSVPLTTFVEERSTAGQISELMSRDSRSCRYGVPLPELARGGNLGGYVLLPHSRWPRTTTSARDLVNSMLDCDETSYFGSSGVVRQLEREFADFVGTRYCIALASGSAALYLAYRALGVRANDEVVVPAYSYPGAVSSLLMLGARVRLCDVDPATGNIDPSSLERVITGDTRAVLATHFWGLAADVRACRSICDDAGAALIEDASHAFGTHIGSQHVGTFGEVGCFSVQSNKTVWGGEGGLLVTNNQELYEQVTLLSSLRDRILETVHHPDNRADWESGRGAKFKMHPLAAALALASLRELPQVNRDRADRVNLLAQQLGPDAGAQVLRSASERTGYYGLKLVLSADSNRDAGEVLQSLIRSGVSAKRLDLRPLHRIAFFRNNPGVYIQPTGYPNAESFFARCISLPHVVEAEEALVRHYARSLHKALVSSAAVMI